MRLQNSHERTRQSDNTLVNVILPSHLFRRLDTYAHACTHIRAYIYIYIYSPFEFGVFKHAFPRAERALRSLWNSGIYLSRRMEIFPRASETRDDAWIDDFSIKRIFARQTDAPRSFLLRDRRKRACLAPKLGEARMTDNARTCIFDLPYYAFCIGNYLHIHSVLYLSTSCCECETRGCLLLLALSARARALFLSLSLSRANGIETSMQVRGC